MEIIPTLVITGPVGVGKTTVANALSERLNGLGKSHALVDLDSIRSCYPTPPDDPFHIALGLRNLGALWHNYHAIGTERLILVDVVEIHSARKAYQQAVPGAVIQIVRLGASLPTLLHRLEGRETGGSLLWHRRRAAELLALMNERQVEDILIQTDEKS